MSVAKKKKGASGFVEELFRMDFYKRNQGRMARQLTALALGLLVLFGVSSLVAGPLQMADKPVQFGVPAVICAVFGWIIFRVVNFPKFADFLISVQAEMDKVTWPSWNEVYRATIVTLVVMFFLGFLLFAYDWFWQMFFKFVGFLL